MTNKNTCSSLINDPALVPAHVLMRYGRNVHAFGRTTKANYPIGIFRMQKNGKPQPQPVSLVHNEMEAEWEVSRLHSLEPNRVFRAGYMSWSKDYAKGWVI